MYSEPVRTAALRLLRTRSLSDTSRATGISRATLRAWRAVGTQPRLSSCPACNKHAPPSADYVALLGFYLGDGCISAHARYFVLRVSCDRSYPSIVQDVVSAVESLRPGRRVFRVEAPGVIVVQSNWKHWPCRFPQHGPGRKHERTIVLEDWQRTLVETHPAAFLRGLFHSDGSRVRNWATRTVAGQKKRYDYPRWQFTNVSADIRELCCWALDLVDVPWRQSNRKTISVSTRGGVVRLDELIGPKR